MLHIDYVKELVARKEADQFIKGDDKVILKCVITESELLKLVERLGDEKHCSIVKTVREIKDAGPRSRRRVTEAQQQALIKHLLERFGTARAALAAAYNMTEAEMFGEVKEAEAKPEVQTEVLEKRASESKEAAEKAQFLGLKKLKGSEKQVAWAETIRAKAIKAYDDELIDSLTFGELMNSKRSGHAKFWIDNRQSIESAIKQAEYNFDL